ncbi:MAG: hypothetical protein Q8P18_30025 [Pseudomonadota bacterium]|nr:hypothetical protein [Pseudomonadota bacterium]
MTRPPTLGSMCSSAPSACIEATFSGAYASDETTTKRYPFAAQTNASDVPVLPPVHSSTVGMLLTLR